MEPGAPQPRVHSSTSETLAIAYTAAVAEPRIDLDLYARPLPEPPAGGTLDSSPSARSDRRTTRAFSAEGPRLRSPRQSSDWLDVTGCPSADTEHATERSPERPGHHQEAIPIRRSVVFTIGFSRSLGPISVRAMSGGMGRVSCSARSWGLCAASAWRVRVACSSCSVGMVCPLAHSPQVSSAWRR